MSSICLVAIVRNEAKYIETMLASALPYCSAAVICDTGSTDGTLDQVRAYLTAWGQPSTLVSDEWVDFAHNRNLALERAEQTNCEWVLLLDGDEQLVVEDAHTFAVQLSAGVWGYNVQHGPVEGFHWHVPRLVRVGRRNPTLEVKLWQYIGACHEYITAEGVSNNDLPRLTGCWINHLEDGKRSEAKLERNRELLLESYQQNPSDPRTVFYLANTYFDQRKFSDAIGHYRRRIAMEGWDQEVFYSAYRLAICHDVMESKSAAADYLTAWNMRPSRVEPLVALSKLYRKRGEPHVAHMMASRAIAIPASTDSLFVDAFQWEWERWMEYGITGMLTGAYKDAVATFAKLAGQQGPQEYRDGAAKNLQLALAKL